MVKPPRKTHAMRVLDAAGIAYAATTYDPSDAFHTAEEAADLLSQPPDAIYKSLIVLSEADSRRRTILVMIPSDAQLDLKSLAAATGDKKLRMATQREAEKLTGMQVGGISALGLLRPGGFEVLIDERALSLDTIHVSAGERGTDLALRPADLITATNARSVALA
jgi:Cys-tRNA(Pro)/Cys-tRNA(Cys) deacylase